MEKLLVEALEKGFHNEQQLGKTLHELNAKAKKSEAYKQLDDAWSIYHTSLDDDEQKFVNVLKLCFKNKSIHFEPNQLEEAMSILEDLGRADEAKEIFEEFFKPKRTFELSFSSVYGSIRAPKNDRVRERVDQLIKEDVQNKDLKQIIHGMIVNSGWNPSDLALLEAQTEESWYIFFKKELRGDINLRFFIKRVLEFRAYRDHNYDEIANTAQEALIRISKESEINKLRLSKFNLDKYENA